MGVWLRSSVCGASAALELLVSNSVTGMPVLDDDGTVVGVVSDYDLLSLEGIAEPSLVSGSCFCAFVTQSASSCISFMARNVVFETHKSDFRVNAH